MKTLLSDSPPAIRDYLGFNFFNFAAIPIFAGVPMLLFAKQLDGSDTLLGVIAAIPALAVLLQLPTASVIPFFGYRKLLLRCWIFSLFPACALVMLPVLPQQIDTGARIALLVICLGLFHGLRVVGTTGMWAWIMQLIPEEIRGKILSQEQMIIAIANLVVMFAFFLLIPPEPGPFFFSLIFASGIILLGLSYRLARKIPDMPVEKPPAHQAGVPWLAMLKYAPFLRLITFSSIFCVGFSAMVVFWVPVLKDVVGTSDRTIFLMVGIGSLSSIVSMLILGKVIDGVGSRPVLHFCVGIVALHIMIWFAVASSLLPFHWSVIMALGMTSGFAIPGFSMAIIRLLMKTVPEMGRTHFFAMFNAINNLMMGLMPIVWGMLLDAVGNWSWVSGQIELNRYSILYFFLIVIFGACLLLSRRLHEDQAMNEDLFFNDMVMKIPIRAWARLNQWIFSRLQ